MKRALDTSSLPVNPLSGVAPSIDSSSSFDSAPPKKPRYAPQFASPAVGSPLVSLGGIPAKPFTPSQSVPYSSGSANFMSTANGAGPQSPLSLGGPLSTPIAQGPNGAAAQGLNGMQIPQSPFLGMMGMGFPMGNFGFNMGMTYPGSPIMSPSMNPNNMTGNYGPAAAAAAAAAAGNTTGRTVYVGNLPAEASVDELLNLVRFGPIENVRILPEKSCVFISFLDGSTAAAFHADASVKKLALHGQELKIGWGKASTVPLSVAQAVAASQATRNVFVGNLGETTNEQELREVCSKFGQIDQVKIVRDKNIGFIHFLSIATAMKVVAHLPQEPGWQDKRVNYGKDRCAYVPKAQQAAVQAAQAQAAAAISSQHAQLPGTPFTPFSPMSAQFGGFGTPTSAGFGSPIFPGGGFPSATSGFMDTSGQSQVGNRNVYLGNIHPDTTTEELCNNIRGGMLQQIRYMPEKHIAFVTFVDPTCALAFFQSASATGLTLNSRRLKIGWGKHSGPLNPTLLQAVQAGASRNVYVGSISDFESFGEEKLRTDFSEFGEIEMVNFLREKSAAFVNFTSIASAQKAIEGIKSKPEYATLRVAYGKDRCANAPRSAQTPGSRPSALRNDSTNNVRGDDAVQAAISAVEARGSDEFDRNGDYALMDDTPASFE